MLLNHDRKIVILTPFKCWSTSIIAYFLGEEGWEELHSLHPYVSGDFRNHLPTYSMIDKHGNIVPNKYSSYKKILIIRNPYERVVSMWKWAHKKFGIDFKTYFYKGINWPTCFPVGMNYPYDELVRVENLFEDFMKFNIMIRAENFPHMNSVNDLNHELTNLEKEIIFWFHKIDFDIGTYKKDLKF